MPAAEGFVNRRKELAALEDLRASGGLAVVYGRRRIGKTRLLTRWLARRGGLFAQAIEASPALQLGQVFEDLRTGLEAPAAPRTWDELFGILDHQTRPLVVCLDEFPYLAQSDPTLPSRIQRWWDHRSRKDTALILCGSSRSMMHDALLTETAPLFGRTRLILNVEPMGFKDFCEALSVPEDNAASFRLFSLVGGIPRYWELIGARHDLLEAADALYFGFASYMENEPRRLLSDEQIAGTSPVSVLEAVGRGAHKPSEIAGRVGVAQTGLAKVLYALMDCGFLNRAVPLGQSERNPKNVLYTISDPSLRFWYQVYSPHKSRWRSYSSAERTRLIDQHASSVFEDCVRSRHPEGRRYWERSGEFDMVRPAKPGGRLDAGVIVSEVKFRLLPERERSALLADIKARWHRTEASRRWPVSRFEVIDVSWLRS